MRTLIAMAVVLLAAGTLSAKSAQVKSVDEVRKLDVETTSVIVTHVYDDGLSALQALPNLESLKVRGWLNYET